MIRQILLGRPFLLVRDDDGIAHAFDDHCPHRGIPLSDGTFDGQEIECCYHGWRFDCEGRCVAIPSLVPDSRVKTERISVRKFDCKEEDGLVWIHIPGKGADKPSEVPRLEKHSGGYKSKTISRPLDCSMDHGIIGLMDPAHGPFVHQAWWWRKQKSIHEKKKRFEPIPLGFRMSSHEPSSNSAAYKILKVYGQPISTTIDFVLPNRRLETIRCGKYWFSSQAVVTPIDADRSRLDFAAAWNLFNGIPLLEHIYGFFAGKFIHQDQEIMRKQAVGLRDNPKLMLIDDADTQAKWYFRLKKAYLDAQKDGEEFEHPLSGPVTLRWRS